MKTQVWTINVASTGYVVVVNEVLACAKVFRGAIEKERHPFVEAGRLKAISSAVISAVRLAETEDEIIDALSLAERMG